MPGSFIVKVQRPLNGPGPCYIYNQDRSVTLFSSEGPMTEKLLKLFGEGEAKVYCHAIQTETGRLVLLVDKRAPDQDW